MSGSGFLKTGPAHIKERLGFTIGPLCSLPLSFLPSACSLTRSCVTCRKAPWHRHKGRFHLDLGRSLQPVGDLSLCLARLGLPDPEVISFGSCWEVPLADHTLGPVLQPPLALVFPAYGLHIQFFLVLWIPTNNKFEHTWQALASLHIITLNTIIKYFFLAAALHVGNAGWNLFTFTLMQPRHSALCRRTF